MATQTENGRAFEWAIGFEASRLTNFTLITNKSLLSAQASFYKMSLVKQTELLKVSHLALEHILKKENKLIEIENGGMIEFNSNIAGQNGDVRDILIHAKGITIGVSCKTNHQALKHPRLSGEIDFVKKWGLDDDGCSQEYWSKIKPIFDDLKKIKSDSNGLKRWEDLVNKPEKYYWPLLDAWSNEIYRLCTGSNENSEKVCKALIDYLIGKYDFYKVILNGFNRLHIQAYNFKKTLSTKKTLYPNCINSINTKNGGIYSKTIVFNHGFSINFRIHSASSKVEPSLKFDINAIGLPTNEIYQQTFDL